MKTSAVLNTLFTTPLPTDEPAPVVPLKVESKPEPVAKAIPLAAPAIADTSAETANAWLRAWLLRLLPSLLGLGLFIGGWALLSQHNSQFPGPAKTWASTMEVFSDPFYKHGPNDHRVLGSIS